MAPERLCWNKGTRTLQTPWRSHTNSTSHNLLSRGTICRNSKLVFALCTCWFSGCRFTGCMQCMKHSAHRWILDTSTSFWRKGWKAHEAKDPWLQANQAIQDTRIIATFITFWLCRPPLLVELAPSLGMSKGLMSIPPSTDPVWPSKN